MSTHVPKHHGRLVFMASFFLALLTMGLRAQILVTSTGGNLGSTTYTSLNAAFAAINLGTHQGAINIQVVGNTTEPAVPNPLLRSNLPSAYTGVTITPAGGNFTISSALAPTANRGIIELAGADNVIINGDDPSTPGDQNLTILSNSVSTAGIACIRLSSNSTTGTDGADNNTVKNCILVGARSATNSAVNSYGIQFSNGTGTVSSTVGAYSSVNTEIDNNIITRCYYGILALGSSALFPNTGTKITRNIIGSANPIDYVAFRGILISYGSPVISGTAALISQNDIRTGFNAASSDLASIEISSGNAGIVITRNNIHESSNPSPNIFGMHGIWVSSAALNNSITITNNFIRDITGYPAILSAGNPFGGWGIYVSAGTRSLIINNNTIVLGSSPFSPASAGVGGCIFLGNVNITVSQMLNNIFFNNVPSQFSRCLYLVQGILPSALVNNNAYYTHPLGSLGNDGTAVYLNLPAWQAGTLKDSNSFTEFPNFVSPTDLHIQNSVIQTYLESGGAPTASTGVLIDIDNTPRPGPLGAVNGGGLAPDIGADEFDGKKTTCPPPARVFVSAITNTSAVVTWTSTGTESAWIINYSSPSATMLAATNPYTITNLAASANHLVKVRAYCGLGDTSSWARAEFWTLCTPPNLISVSGPPVCSAGSTTLGAVTSATNNVNWYSSPSGGLVVATGTNFITPSLTTTTNYYVAPMAVTGTATAAITFTSNSNSSASINSGVIFDAQGDFLLKSVTVYPTAPMNGVTGTITVALMDGVGNVLQTVTQTVVSNVGPTAQLVNLDFKIQQGNTYKLALVSITGISGLSYNAFTGYPIVSPGLVSINLSHNLGPTTTDFMFFYNWQLQLGCEAPRVPVAAVINQKPTLYASAITGTVCEGGTANLVALGSGASYTWNPGGMTTQNVSVVPNTTTVYTVSSQNVPNCASTATIALTVNPAPTVNVASASVTVCTGETATLSASGTSSTYNWSNGAGNSATVYVMPGVNTNYSVTGYGANGCSSTKVVTVQVNQAPSLLVSSSKNVACLNEPVHLYATSPATSYQWSNGGTTSMITVSPSVTTTYSVSAGGAPCSAKGSVVVIVEACTGIGALDKTNSMAIYPNPVGNVLNITYTGGLANKITLKMFDAIGKLVLEQPITQEVTKINVAGLEDGVYFYHLNNDAAGTINVGKIVKQ